MNELSLLERISRLPQSDDKSDPYILRARKTHARSYMAWNEEEDQLLISLLKNGCSLAYISRQLKRSSRAVETRISVLGAAENTSNEAIEEKQGQLWSMDNNKDPAIALPKCEIKRILHYWRNSLADAEKIGLSSDKLKQGEVVTINDLKRGQLSQLKIRRFFEEAENAIKKEQQKRKKYQAKRQSEIEEDVIIRKLSVIIAPYTLVPSYGHGKKYGGERSLNEVFPLWLVADITREGELIPTEEITYPWIERRCLTPNEEKKGSHSHPVIGDVAEVDEFYTLNVSSLSEKPTLWCELFSYAQDLFFSLIDEHTDVLNEQNFCLLETGYLLPINEIKDVAQSLLTTYDQYLAVSTKKIPKILKHFCSLKDEKPAEDLSDVILFTASLNHLAQAQCQYPLAASQRTSLGYFNQVKDDGIFTVHGPPGTGKTTLLLSVIASQWVEAAINKQFPPILVAASTNNLAVLNILEQFKKIDQQDTAQQSIRWLPDFDSYGMYLASSRKAKEAEEKGFPYRLKKSNFSSIASLYEEEYRHRAKAYFLSRYNEHFQKNEVELEPCLQFLHQQLLTKHELLQKTIQFAKNFYFLKEKYSSIETLENEIAEKETQHAAILKKITYLKEVRTTWFLFKSTQLKWPRIFKWLPIGKSLLEDRLKLFISQYSQLFPTTIVDLDEVETILNDLISNEENLINQIKQVTEELLATKKNYSEFLEEKNKLEKQLTFQITVDDIFSFSSSNNLLSKLDTTLRYELFILASRYWEASWLAESVHLSALKSHFDDRKKFWQIQAMLTPCFVTTLHSGPGFFQYKAPSQMFETLANFIDLLIIDEAGQVMPAIAAPLVSTAKKVFLVGDPKQIEPIYSLTESIDLANAKKYGLCQDEHGFEELKKKGILCSGDPHTTHAYGNLIVLGARKSPYHLKNHAEPGMLLTEHRRCAKEIINYCNALCYNNQLQPLTVEKPSPYPRMGYAHIKGQTEKRGSSRCNKLEAEAIVAWIIKNEAKILSACEKVTLDECIGIVTPYFAQGKMIKNLLHQFGLLLKKVGTVHALQGAEKPIIIFSLVCTAGETQPVHFFDKSPNMLNVAVSRAQQSFLVFGDMDILDPNKGKRPSSLLAKFLFAKEENEIVDIVQPKFKVLEKEESDNIWQITTLEGHRKILKRAFQKAQYELNIVSPFLGIRAIEMDGIISLIEQCSLTIKINIYTDPTLNLFKRQEFNHACFLLEEAGAEVYLANNVHSKIITIDHDIFIEGSFNWLSAARAGKYVREECSIIYKGRKVVEFIRKAMDPIKAKTGVL